MHSRALAISAVQEECHVTYSTPFDHSDPEWDIPIRGFLSLADLRRADPALDAWAQEQDPRIGVPMGLSGVFSVVGDLLDDEANCELASVSVELREGMSALDLMRVLADWWKAYPQMDDLVLALVHAPKLELRQLDVALYFSGGVKLSDEEWWQFPIAENEDGAIEWSSDDV